MVRKILSRENNEKLLGPCTPHTGCTGADGKCSKKFPFNYRDRTVVDDQVLSSQISYSTFLLGQSTLRPTSKWR